MIGIPITIVPESWMSATVSFKEKITYRQSLVQQLNRVKLDVRNSNISISLFPCDIPF
jgi:hypothetical protein